MVRFSRKIFCGLKSINCPDFQVGARRKKFSSIKKFSFKVFLSKIPELEKISFIKKFSLKIFRGLKSINCPDFQVGKKRKNQSHNFLDFSPKYF
jgi:hypothetical protein